MKQSQWLQIYGRDFPTNQRSVSLSKITPSPPPAVPFLRQKPVVIVKPGSRWRSIRMGLRDLFLEFCSHSTIHGVSYFGGSRQRSMCEKFWWIMVFLLSLYGCGKLIDNIYRKWDENPVIVTFDEKPTPVWQIPFPAVTICPEAKIKKVYLNFTELFLRFAHDDPGKLNRTELDLLLSTLQVCDEWFHAKTIYRNKYDNFANRENIVKVLERISFKVKDTIYYCRLHSIHCEEMFTETVTEEGICMTFNGFSSSEMFRMDNLHTDYEYLKQERSAANWSLERGYPRDADLNTYPVRVLGSGFKAGLYVQLMTTNHDLEYHCRESQGFKVILHAPSDYPQVSTKFVRVTLGRDITIAVKPQIIGTEEELFEYSPDRRQCYFNDERQLMFYRVYSQGNCQLECLTNYTLKLCGCVKYSMPRVSGTRICETSQLNCAFGAQMKLLELIANYRTRNSRVPEEINCHCLPGCNSIQYDAEITQTIFNFKETLKHRLAPLNISYEDSIRTKQISKLEIYFKDVQFITSKRTELYGMTDFVASCGGILGLCMGVSLLSLVELLYFVSIRPLMLVRQTLQRGIRMIQVDTGKGRY